MDKLSSNERDAVVKAIALTAFVMLSITKEHRYDSYENTFKAMVSGIGDVCDTLVPGQKNMVMARLVEEINS